ncbi:ABC-type multidrug transport system, ATPase component [Gottschalkia purinilytica]|uniref:ABC-type multidrug transport system, ATPase component n=1 Tax=Gottschalkia purinilytica TaxID=1503 RepID=A0A0L0W9C0_GOTPU|nr:ABC transporter ATP-binding protein [Gottschalkia purinilytica]KNF08153.1 ABC-type multidrug transport system, ATPase component [Gottschalkia purinilytica]
MLRIEKLTKNYGKFTAVNELSLEVKNGEIFGFVGPNGAGKTTTFKMISTLLRPTSGKVYIDGIDISKNIEDARRSIGYMPDFFGVYDNLKVNEYLEFYGDVAGLSKEEIKEVSDDLLELVDLKHKKNVYVDSLSRGMKQKLCLARCLMHNPKLLILDEPASGMDPRARVQMKEILRELKDMGKTIIISSHILPELAELCTRIGIVENGQVIVTGSVNEIMEKIQKENSVIKIKVLKEREKAIKFLKEQPLVRDIHSNGETLEVEYEGGEEEMYLLLKHMILQEIPVTSFSLTEDNLEEIFMKVTKGGNE